MYSNKAGTFLDLATSIMDARLAAAQNDLEKRHQKTGKNAVSRPRTRSTTASPPNGFYPVRESLGSALLLNGEADQAEAVFSR